MRINNVIITGGKWVFEDEDILNEVTFRDSIILFNTNKCNMVNVNIYNCVVIYKTDIIDLQDSNACTIINSHLYSAIDYITKELKR